MKKVEDNNGGTTSCNTSSVTQVGDVASGKNGKLDTFSIKRKPDQNGFYEMLLELDDYKD